MSQIGDLGYPYPARAANRPWLFWVLGCLAMIAGVAAAELTSDRLGPVSGVAGAAVTTAVWLSAVFLWPRDRRLGVAALTAGAALVVHGSMTYAFGQPLASRPQYAAVNLLQAGVVLLVYRLLCGRDQLAPRRPADLLALLAASVVGAAVVLPLGPLPHLDIDDGATVQFWWVARNAAYCFNGLACAWLIWQTNPGEEAEPTRLRDLYGQITLTGACMLAIFAFPDLPLSWAILIPAIWAGMTLGTWVAAAFAATVSTAGALAGAAYSPVRVTDTFRLPPPVLIDVLLCVFVFVVLMLALLGDQRAWLVHELRRRRQVADDQAGLLGVVFESISEGLVMIGAHQRLEMFNMAARSILGAQLQPMVLQVLDSGQESTTLPTLGEDGNERWLAFETRHVHYAGERKTVMIVRDVTVEQQRIDELTQFAGVTAHDLKSPLTAVHGWLEMAGESLETNREVARTALERGLAASTRMSREIDEWLAYNVAREGILHPVELDLGGIVDDLAATFGGAVITVLARERVFADPTLTRQLMLNLIGNAVKYTEPGQPAVITVATEADGPGWVRVDVADEGIGIPAGEEVLVFEPFRRATSVSGRYAGSGLGLALCKRIVNRHGGEISARRNPEGGSTISFTLPSV